MKPLQFSGAGQRRRNGRPQLGYINRLHEIAECTAGIGLIDGVRIIECAEHHEGNVVERPQSLSQLQATVARHTDIQNHQVRSDTRSQQVLGLFGRVCHADLISAVLQTPGHGCKHQAIIIHHKNVRGGRRTVMHSGAGHSDIHWFQATACAARVTTGSARVSVVTTFPSSSLCARRPPLRGMRSRRR
ncbi:hypothetical protein D3C71_1039410 [compost metagenome]